MQQRIDLFIQFIKKVNHRYAILAVQTEEYALREIPVKPTNKFITLFNLWDTNTNYTTNYVCFALLRFNL